MRSLTIFAVLSGVGLATSLEKRKSCSDQEIHATRSITNALEGDPEVSLNELISYIPSVPSERLNSILEGKRAFVKLPMWVHTAITFYSDDDPRFLQAFSAFELSLAAKGNTSECVALIFASWKFKCVDEINRWLRGPVGTPPCVLGSDKVSFVLNSKRKRREALAISQTLETC